MAIEGVLGGEPVTVCRTWAFTVANKMGRDVSMVATAFRGFIAGLVIPNVGGCAEGLTRHAEWL